MHLFYLTKAEKSRLIINIIAEYSTLAVENILKFSSCLEKVFDNANIKNPLDPNSLCQMAKNAFRLLDIPNAKKLTIYNAFGKLVLGSLNELLGALLDALEQQGISVEQRSNHRDIYSHDPYQSAESALSDEQAGYEAPRENQDVTADPFADLGTVFDSLFKVDDHAEKVLSSDGLIGLMREVTDVICSTPGRSGYTSTTIETPSGGREYSSMLEGARYATRLGRRTIVGEGPEFIIPRPQLVGLLSNIQSQIHKADTDLGSDESVLLDVHEALISEISNQLPQNQTNKVERSDDDIINLVSIMFDFIMDDVNLPNALKVVLARLQLPVIRFALIEAELFDQPEHVVRQLLNVLAEAGAKVDHGDSIKTNRYFGLIDEAVKTIVALDMLSEEVVFSVYGDFVAKYEALNMHVSRVEERTRETARGQAKLESVKRQAEMDIQQKIDSFPFEVPVFVADFLLNDWMRLLVRIGLKAGVEDRRWASALKLAHRLLWSVEPALVMKKQKEWTQLLPQIVKSLQKGVVEASVPQDRSSQFFIKLEECHTQVLHQLSESQLSGGFTSISKRKNSADASRSDSLDQQQSDDVERCGSQPLACPYDKQIKAWQPGTLLCFSPATSEHSFRCKLAEVLEESGTYIFVNARGQKVLEQSLYQLKIELQHNRLMVVDVRSVFDRALGSVKGLLANVRRQELLDQGDNLATAL